MFYARRTRRRESPDHVDIPAQVNEEKLFPLFQQLPGFMGAYWLANRATREADVFTFWESQAAAESSRPTVVALHAQFFNPDPGEVLGRDHFEVVAKTGDKVHRSATHAAVVEWGGDPGQLEAYISAVEQKGLPLLRQDTGFLGGFWLADRKKGGFVSVTLHDSQANLEASEERERRQLAEGEGPFPSSYSVEPRHYEIITRVLTMAEKTA